jgi:hypothetical protein
MRPHPTSAILLCVDAIPIHPAKYAPGEEREVVRPLRLLDQAAFSVWVSRLGRIVGKSGENFGEQDLRSKRCERLDGGGFRAILPLASTGTVASHAVQVPTNRAASTRP